VQQEASVDPQRAKALSPDTPSGPTGAGATVDPEAHLWLNREEFGYIFKVQKIGPLNNAKGRRGRWISA
jgi:hypothetical protein